MLSVAAICSAQQQADGFWTVITPSLVPGLHDYTVIVDSAEFADPGSRAFFGGKYASAVEVPEPGAGDYAINDVGQATTVAEVVTPRRSARAAGPWPSSRSRAIPR